MSTTETAAALAIGQEYVDALIAPLRFTVTGVRLDDDGSVTLLGDGREAGPLMGSWSTRIRDVA